MFLGRALCEVIGIPGMPACHNWHFACWQGAGSLIFACFCICSALSNV